MFGPPLCHLDQWLIFYLAQKNFFGPAKAALISGTYINIKTEVNRNSTTSTFLFVWYLDESWDHAVWYYSIEATTTNKNKKTKKLMLIYEITILNIALINFIMIVSI